MKKVKSKSAAQKRKSKAKAKTREEEKKRANWVDDRLEWVKLVDCDFTGMNGTYCSHSNDDDGYDEIGLQPPPNQSAKVDGEAHDMLCQESDFTVSIISWNVLADSYCSRSSHKNLPSKFQSRVFNRNQRQHQVRQMLRLFNDKLSPDFIALQEVDPPLEVGKCMKSLGYGIVETVSSPGGGVGRVDSCGLYFQADKWNLLEHETVFLDDLAILRRASSQRQQQENKFEKVDEREPVQSETSCVNPGSKSNSGSLKGLERSFVRKNVALMTRLEHKDTKHQVIIVVAHLFWNPAYEYVKLCQAHYIAKRASIFRRENENVPILWCGDFNSQPRGYVHQYLTKGVVNAKNTAPWYKLSRKHPSINADITSQEFGSLSISDAKTDDIVEEGDESPVRVRYLLDYTLNRFCRWLRILGIDAALETEEEERERTKDGNITIFLRCKDERRSLVTTASKLLSRKDCPPGTYLLDTKSLLNLESAIVHLLVSHGVVLRPTDILSRCVVCNGSIEPVHDEDQRQTIFRTYQAPEEVENEIMDVYQCNGCSQGYWWCEKPTSSASRVKSQASRLLELCIRGGVPFNGDLGMFDYIDVQKLRKEGEEDENQLDFISWLQSDELENPLPQMASAYATKETGKESLPFTNVTYDFVGHLDYILYQTQAMEVTDLLYVPKTFQELNDLNITNGHLLPSCDWPSDHLAIGCQLSLRQNSQNSKDFVNVRDQTPKGSKSNPVSKALPPTNKVDYPSNKYDEDPHDHSHGHHHDEKLKQYAKPDGHQRKQQGDNDDDQNGDHDHIHDHIHDHEHHDDHEHCDNHDDDRRDHGHHIGHSKAHDHDHDHHHTNARRHDHDHTNAHRHDHDHTNAHHHDHDHTNSHHHDNDHHNGHKNDHNHDNHHDHTNPHDHDHHQHGSDELGRLNSSERCSFFAGPKLGPVPFPPGPPSSVPWCSFIESDAVAREMPSKQTSASEAERCMMVGGICVCYGMGCLPTTPSLFEMAELRRQYRLKFQNGG